MLTSAETQLRCLGRNARSDCLTDRHRFRCHKQESQKYKAMYTQNANREIKHLLHRPPKFQSTERNGSSNISMLNNTTDHRSWAGTLAPCEEASAEDAIDEDARKALTRARKVRAVDRFPASTASFNALIATFNVGLSDSAEPEDICAERKADTPTSCDTDQHKHRIFESNGQSGVMM